MRQIRYIKCFIVILMLGLWLNVDGRAKAETPSPAPTVAPETTEQPSITPTITPEITPTPTPVVTLDRIEALNIPSEIPYSSSFTEKNVILTAYYSDGSSKTVNPDVPFTLNTSLLGEKTIELQYQELAIEILVTVVPRQVTELKMVKGTESSMKVRWNALEEADLYQLYTSTEKEGEYVLFTTTEKTEYEFKNLIRGEITYLKVQAVGENQVGEYSEVLPVAPTPAKVTGVNATKNEKKKITLTWDEAKGAHGYAIYYRLSTEVNYKKIATTTKLTYEITGLAVGKDYYFVVYAYGGNDTNLGEGSEPRLEGTAPASAKITKVKGGDKRVKAYWKQSAGVEYYEIYYSTQKSSGYTLAGSVSVLDFKLYGIDGLKQNKKYYVKIITVRNVGGKVLTSTSNILYATTKNAKKTSTAAKYYTTKKKFKKSPAYKKYKAFRKRVNFKKSFVLPGMKATNAGGFTVSRMIPQSIAFAGNYMLISAYDYSGQQESVIYVMNRLTRKYITSIILPHTGHVGGMAFDGKNLWIARGKKVDCLSYDTIHQAAISGKEFKEIYRFTTTVTTSSTVSYMTYYNGRVWAGEYNQYSSKYMYGYLVGETNGVPTLTQINKILMPNRTQGVAFTAKGKMIISRSCQTKAGKSGFMSRLDIYQPTWDETKQTIKKNKLKKKVQMPPMNEGIAVYGSYTYVLYESVSFSECSAPVDRVAAFKTSKIV